MHKAHRWTRPCFLLVSISLIFPSRLGVGEKAPAKDVIVYTALDEIYSAPILKAFEQRTGLHVRCVYDSEAAKTVGLVSRLRAEASRPRCDVFWNNEILHTLELQRDGLLAPCRTTSSLSIPPMFRDPQGHWTGFAGRLRVIAFNTNRLTTQTAPHNIQGLTEAKWKGRVGMSYPLFGTNATHAAVLFAAWGEKRATDFYTRLKANDIKIMEGNMTAARAVADGELDVCLTDSDDVRLLQSQNLPISFLPAGHDDGKVLLIPNTVSLIKGAPHPDAGRSLIDFLLSAEVEEMLSASPSAQIPLQFGVSVNPFVARLAAAPRMNPQYSKAAGELTVSAPFLKRLFAAP